MAAILYLAHRIPFPPDRGDKIRSFHMLQALARLAPVHVACFADNLDELAHQNELAALAQTHCVVQRTKSMALAGVEAILKGKPVSLTAFHHQALADYVARTIDAQDISTIFCFSGQMGQYIPADFQGRIVLDLVDVDSMKFESYAETSSSAMAYIYRREGRMLSQFEHRMADRADVVSLVSENEANLFRRRMAADGHAAADHIRSIANGIDCVRYDPHHDDLTKAVSATVAEHDIIFTGQMDYPPNVDAVTHFAAHVMPAVVTAVPGARFIIAGRSPTDAVRALHNAKNIIVTGEVEDIRTWLNQAAIAVAPLMIARGVQNKVLEAMAMEKSVVVSPEAATGIDAVNGTHFVVAEDNASFVAVCVDLLRDKGKARAMGTAARRYVQDTMSWQAQLEGLDTIVFGEDVSISDAA
ncbi:TIGR03087 family PEP-CTERM/XrtA system glycosyltransferase [Alterisphingorhabdus coralli]|uniref:TIGR03087 family PEP-CTERM/XrtA system glycosyltransferase n=1 Tax=Alterisphingorhabdus coralli TaxID=3071408 RepID=A0AA97F3S4_9SPHN|nr:TIGR03087 family PEP-CTERM/XrtA system glycosyltransferase [Parasphingorhabdus sp. SCSIO 66989]WOE73784.1 TIGR03087 family PEP-CTERM/XrtA system glycosyltransferase [Parasphingorhabdus sp. SCSIO 66989]